MQHVEPPDSHYLNAATGWLELGNLSEARAEWDKISVANRHHPETLDVCWRIEAALKNWPEALKIAGRLIKAAPQSPLGWINQSYSLHELKRTQEAFDHLLPLAKQFPKVSTIPYNLACYACQLGRRKEAEIFLHAAIRSKGKEEIKTAALRDPDLEPMWAIIEEL